MVQNYKSVIQLILLSKFITLEKYKLIFLNIFNKIIVLFNIKKNKLLIEYYNINFMTYKIQIFYY